jgi:hypothetical protein
LPSAVFKGIRNVSIAGDQCSSYGHRHQPFQSIVAVRVIGTCENADLVVCNIQKYFSREWLQRLSVVGVEDAVTAI